MMPDMNQSSYGQTPAPCRPLLPKGGKIALICGIALTLLGALISLILLLFPSLMFPVFGGPEVLYQYARHWVVLTFAFSPVLLRTVLYTFVGLFLLGKSGKWTGQYFPGILLAAISMIGLFGGRFFAFLPNLIAAKYGESILAAYSIMSSAVSSLSGTLQTVGALLVFGCCCYAVGRASQS